MNSTDHQSIKTFNQIIIKPLINIVDVTTSVGNACIVGVHSWLRLLR